MSKQTFSPNKGRLLGRTRVLFPFARRAVRAPMLLVVALATVMVLAAGCDSGVAPDVGAVEALMTTSDAPMNARGSWNNWHVHDGGTGQVDETGLTHLPLAVFPKIFGPTYAETPSLHAYCPNGVDKGLVGGDGGSKISSGTCQNEDTLIHLKNQANGAPAPEGWTAVTPSGPINTVYYRLTSR